MPIYAYRCSSCGFEKDVLQKLSDPTLTQCPHFGKEAFGRTLTAPAFQLKGTGWYVTDFRENGAKKEGKDGGAGETAASSPSGGETSAAGGTDKAPAASSSPTPAPAPAPAPAAKGADGPA